MKAFLAAGVVCASVVVSTQPTARIGANAVVAADGSGGSVINISKVNAEQIKVDTSGGARVNLSGTGKDLTIHMSGGSGVKAMDIPAASVQVSGSGGAHAEVAASQ